MIVIDRLRNSSKNERIVASITAACLGAVLAYGTGKSAGPELVREDYFEDHAGYVFVSDGNEIKWDLSCVIFEPIMKQSLRITSLDFNRNEFIVKQNVCDDSRIDSSDRNEIVNLAKNNL